MKSDEQIKQTLNTRLEELQVFHPIDGISFLVFLFQSEILQLKQRAEKQFNDQQIEHEQQLNRERMEHEEHIQVRESSLSILHVKLRLESHGNSQYKSAYNR